MLPVLAAIPVILGLGALGCGRKDAPQKIGPDPTPPKPNETPRQLLERCLPGYNRDQFFQIDVLKDGKSQGCSYFRPSMWGKRSDDPPIPSVYSVVEGDSNWVDERAKIPSWPDS